MNLSKTGMLLVFTSLFINGCAAPKSTYTTYTRSEFNLSEVKSISLRLPNADLVTFRGLPNYDSVGSAGGGTLYPGDTAGLFVASLLVHALVVDSVKNAQKQKEQEKADRIILPYKPIIEDFSYDVLKYLSKDNIQEGSLPFNFDSENGNLDELYLDTQPIFFISEDHSSIILKNIVSLWRDPDKPQILYENLIEIHSYPFSNDFVSNDGYNKELNENLLNESALLFTQSIDYLSKDLHQNIFLADEKEKTHRYFQSGEDTFERGVLLEKNCSRITIRTLRGWIKSVISNQNLDEDNCF